MRLHLCLVFALIIAACERSDGVDASVRLQDGRSLTLRAEGELGGYRWEFRGDIMADGASEWINFFDSSGGGGGGSGGGSGGGALPFEDLGWKVSGHVGSFGVHSGWSRRRMFRKHIRPTAVTGVVSATAARVVAIFEDEGEVEAKLLESGHSDVRFFLAMNVKGRPLVELVVLDPAGLVLERVPLPKKR